MAEQPKMSEEKRQPPSRSPVASHPATQQPVVGQRAAVPARSPAEALQRQPAQAPIPPEPLHQDKMPQPVAGAEAERGEPSKFLTRSEGGIVDDSPGYTAVTTGSSQRGIYNIVGGYLDPDGVIHSEFELRGMDGVDEDILQNESAPVIQRLQALMINCTERVGTILDRGPITSIVSSKLLSGSRQHLLMCIRRVSHGDIYPMEAKCPNEKCGKVRAHDIDLSEAELYDMEDPTLRTDIPFTLPVSNIPITWSMATGAHEQILTAIGRLPKEERRHVLTYSAMVRLDTIDGESVKIGVGDMLDPKRTKLKLSKRAQKLFQTVQRWAAADRDALRSQFFEEPGVETALELTCPECGQEFEDDLNIAQVAFFFPSQARKPSRRRRST